jgi:hypothetical protein
LIQAYANLNPQLNRNATNNTISDCRVKSLGEAFAIRGKGAHGNRFLRCSSDFAGTITNPGANDGLGGIRLDSTKNNTFSRMWIANAKCGVYVGGYDQETPDSPWASENNVFENCIFHRCVLKGLDLNWRENDNWNRHTTTEGTAQDVTTSRFVNCTFSAADPVNSTAFVWSNREVTNSPFYNCIIVDFDKYVDGEESPWQYDATIGQYTEKHTFPLPGFVFFNCCFSNPATFNAAIPMAQGAGNKNVVNPGFAPTGTYELSSTSPCVNSGAAFSFLYPGDFDGGPRVQHNKIDIGAQESPHP